MLTCMGLNKIFKQVVNSRIMLEILSYISQQSDGINLTQLKNGANLPYIPTNEIRLLKEFDLVETYTRGKPIYVKISKKGKEFYRVISEADHSINNLLS